jgi:hypothetical protein
MNPNRNPKGYYEPSYENLGKSKVVRMPEELLGEIKELLSLLNKFSNNRTKIKQILSQFIEILIIIIEWSNDDKDPVKILEKMIVGYKEISQ